MTSDATVSNLPDPDPEELAHAARVAALIRERIAAAGGALGFAEFMRLALYAPGLGYYSAGAAKLGETGDFVTAPELSELFGRCLARQCAELLERAPGSILELGAGSGRLATTLLGALERLGALPERYEILEVSAELRERQRAELASLPPALARRVGWRERLPERGSFSGIVLANEVLDAMPCERFVWRANGPRALAVGLDAAGGFVWREIEPQANLWQEIERLRTELPEPWPEDYVSEVCPEQGGLIASLAHALGRGAVLLVDYGLPRAHYYHPQRTDGTLRCHFRHRVHDDPLWHPGLQDITAWVDFTRIAEAAAAAGLEIAGFATQAAFLLGCGIENLLAGDATDPVAQVRRAAEARRLLLPGEMGEAFKVMALTRDIEGELVGFALQDLRASL